MAVLIFNNNADFIETINYLNDYVNSKDEFIDLTVKLNGISDVNNEIEFIKKQHILGFSGYTTQCYIKVSLKSSYGFKAIITYMFKNNNKNLYRILLRNLRKLEWK